MFQILAVEDTEEFQKIILRTLGDYTVRCCSSAEEASQVIRNRNFDLIIIDINLPQRDGYSLLTELQSNEETSKIPVLCLTGRTEMTDKVTAFSLGADDYITKPFDPIELRARVDLRLKKSLRQSDRVTTTKIGDLEIDHARHRVTINTQTENFEPEITQTEYKLLCHLARRPDQVFTRDQLLVSVWGEDAKVLDRVVDVHVCLLRKKIEKSSLKIKAVSVVGYKLSKTNKKIAA